MRIMNKNIMKGDRIRVCYEVGDHFKDKNSGVEFLLIRMGVSVGLSTIYTLVDTATLEHTRNIIDKDSLQHYFSLSIQSTCFYK